MTHKHKEDVRPDTKTAADFLTEEEIRAIETVGSGDVETCRVLAEKLDQSSWVPMFLYGCADMAKGRHADALAKWMVSANTMENVRDMAAAADAIARSVTRSIVR